MLSRNTVTRHRQAVMKEGRRGRRCSQPSIYPQEHQVSHWYQFFSVEAVYFFLSLSLSPPPPFRHCWKPVVLSHRRSVFLLLRQLPAVARRLGPSCNKTPSLHACLLSGPNLRHGLRGRVNDCKKKHTQTLESEKILWVHTELFYTDSFDPQSLSGVCRLEWDLVRHFVECGGGWAGVGAVGRLGRRGHGRGKGADLEEPANSRCSILLYINCTMYSCCFICVHIQQGSL